MASPRAPKTPTAAHFWVDELPRAFDVVGGDLSSFLRHSVRKIFCRRGDACDRSDHLDQSVSVWNKSLGNSNHRRFLWKGGIYPSWESVSLRRRPDRHRRLVVSRPELIFPSGSLQSLPNCRQSDSSLRPSVARSEIEITISTLNEEKRTAEPEKTTWLIGVVDVIQLKMAASELLFRRKRDPT